ncbi:GNAT family N-acetyltransferase [Haloimpatiens massiliensis]|uniref:GNAT family N-acetyltransferase n=1 Tax=Haloimpatiens massiliensis TaxID=1658110 RepID=UPI000C849782|nr:N-acetyltransferase [Haloimpatiens massiliensis]
MNLILVDFTRVHAKEVCDWKYDGEYSIYNYPEWDKISNAKWGVTIEEKRKSEFKAVIDECNCLCGYIRLMNKDKYVLIGLALKPSLCGKGLGKVLMEILKQQCKKVYPDKKIVLEVRSFNERAIKCYKRAGFNVIDTYERDTPLGCGQFIRMEFTY